MSNSPKYRVPALDKAFDILEFLAGQQKALSQTEIARQLGRNANEIYRVLVSLESRGYLVKEALTGHFRVSLKLYNLSRSISPVDQIRQVAIPQMEDLAVELGLSCHLCVLYQSQAMVLIHARSQTPVSLNIREGVMFSTVQSVSGMVLLANSNPEVRSLILERDKGYQHWSEQQKDEFTMTLVKIRDTGTYAANSPNAQGVFECATIIGNPDDQIIASLAVSALQYATTDQLKLDRIKQVLETTAKSIAKQIDLTCHDQP